MSRDPRQRFASALEFAEALRAVQFEQGLPATPVEVAVDEWAPEASGINFSDTSARGPARSVVEYASPRKRTDRQGVAARTRDEDTGIAQARPRRRRTWVWVAVAAVAAVLCVVGAFILGGVV